MADDPCATAAGCDGRDIRADVDTYPVRPQRGQLVNVVNATCQHHWHRYEGDDDIPAHRQCLWCCDVVWQADEERDGTAP